MTRELGLGGCCPDKRKEREAVSRLLLTGAATTQVLIYKEYMMELVIILSQKKKKLDGVSVRVIGEVGLRRKRKLNRWMKKILSQFWGD